MEQSDFNNVVEIFNESVVLYIGILPNIEEVKFGYSYIKSKFTLYCMTTDRSFNELKKRIKNNKSVNFIIWANNGKVIQGDGIAIILETKEEKVNGINYIIKHTHEKNINEINDILLFQIEVENVFKIKQKQKTVA